MRILVCFKVLDNYDEIAPSEWETIDKSKIEFEYVKKIISPYDEAALENALIIKDNLPDVTITAITIGNFQDNSNIYKNLFGIGINEVIQYNTKEDIRFDYLTIGKILADACKQADLILMGQKNAESMNSLTPYVVAKQLDFEMVVNVYEFSFKDNEIYVKSQINNGFEIKKLNVRSIVAIGNAKHSYLRMATLREKLAAKDKREENVNLTTDLSKEKSDIPAVQYSVKIKNCKYILEKDNEKIANILLSQYLKR